MTDVLGVVPVAGLPSGPQPEAGHGSRPPGPPRPPRPPLFEEPPERNFQCRSCSRVERSRHVPVGWYNLRRAVGTGDRHQRLGLYCTLPCLFKSYRRLQEGAARHGDRLGLPGDDYVELSWRFRRALELMQDGLSLSQAGDALGIPTATLRDWLRAANICLDDQAGLHYPDAPAASSLDPVSHDIARFLANCPAASPISNLNELCQAGLVRNIVWNCQSSGPPHRPTFTVTMSGTVTATSLFLTADGQAATKRAARTAAAEAFLEELSASGDEEW